MRIVSSTCHLISIGNQSKYGWLNVSGKKKREIITYVSRVYLFKIIECIRYDNREPSIFFSFCWTIKYALTLNVVLEIVLLPFDVIVYIILTVYFVHFSFSFLTSLNIKMAFFEQTLSTKKKSNSKEWVA
jgi:hypothetical protein